MSRIQVLVVDDSAFMRKALRDLLTTKEIEVIDTARDGREALVKIRDLEPDVVTMDIAMPGMDGLKALTQIMAEKPTPVLMLSAMDKKHADIVIRSLELGAIDFVSKPSGAISIDIRDIRDEMISKIKMAAKILIPQKKIRYRPKRTRGDKEVVTIASSAGGPAALTRLLPELPEDLDAAILVAQHMPPTFTSSLAERLSTKSKIVVKEAKNGMPVEKGTAMIGAGGKHMTINSDMRVELIEKGNHYNVSPSADLLMKSAASIYGEGVLGVVLTGMGHDGSAGAIAIKMGGGSVIAQDETTCLVYGMPKAARDTGCVDEEIPLPYIANTIVRYCNG